MVDTVRTSPGWVCPVNPTRSDVARIEGIIEKDEYSGDEYEKAGFLNAASVARAHAGNWRDRLAEVKAQIRKRKAERVAGEPETSD